MVSLLPKTGNMEMETDSAVADLLPDGRYRVGEEREHRISKRGRLGEGRPTNFYWTFTLISRLTGPRLISKKIRAGIMLFRLLAESFPSAQHVVFSGRVGLPRLTLPTKTASRDGRSVITGDRTLL